MIQNRPADRVPANPDQERSGHRTPTALDSPKTTMVPIWSTARRKVPVGGAQRHRIMELLTTAIEPTSRPRWAGE